MKIHRIVALSAVLTLPVMTSLAQSGAILATGTFHGAVNKTSGRATVYQAKGGNVLRLTHFSTFNGPNVHVLLIAAADAKDDENFLTEKVDRIDLGPLKGNEAIRTMSFRRESILRSINLLQFSASVSMPALERHHSKSSSPCA
jgi:hypothetical protein